MKKMVALLFVLLFIVSVSFAETEVDLSSMTYDELVALKDQINLAIWNSNDWQEVEVPQGVWMVGEDIPAGHWTIKNGGGYCTWVYLGTKLDETGYDIDVWHSDFYFGESVMNPNASYFDPARDKVSIDVDLKNGTYVIIDDATAIFTPFAGKQSLGFK